MPVLLNSNIKKDSEELASVELNIVATLTKTTNINNLNKRITRLVSG